MRCLFYRVGLLLSVIILTTQGAIAQEPAPDKIPSIGDYATIEAFVGEEEAPVYAFGSTYVYSVSPDILPGVKMQRDNPNPITKFVPKKSWEISHSLCGLTPTREPRSRWNDDQPLLPIHLIDGDPETAWCSHGETSAWIRIDIPRESEVTAVNLVCSQRGPAVNAGIKVGKALPQELAIKVSSDARNWRTVYQSDRFTGAESGPNRVEFEPCRAKQIWITGGKLSPVFHWGPAFSIGEIEVLDSEGNNLALVSRGAGVQVSSTDYGLNGRREIQEMLWPLQYDLGFKWTRVGYDLGAFLWSNIEREKGKFVIDPLADRAVTEAHANGIKVILVLDKGNWLYHDPPRKTAWKKARVSELMDTYLDHPGWPDRNPQMMAGYLSYVEHMVRHFKGRVEYYEILNEWAHLGLTLERYAAIVRATIPVIKRADPDAKIMLGGTSGFEYEGILACLGKAQDPTVCVHNGTLRCASKKPRNYVVTLAPTSPSIVIHKNCEVTDAEVDVAVLSKAEAGIILRAKDESNFLLAMYSPRGEIYFHEVIGDKYGPLLDKVAVPPLNPKIRLHVTVAANEVQLQVTDGKSSFKTSHRIQHFLNAGKVGVFHFQGATQYFDNFKVTTDSGRQVLEETFDEPDGTMLRAWATFSNYPTVPPGIAQQIDAIGWHPYQKDPENEEYLALREEVNLFKKECVALGFRGQYAASEWCWYEHWTEIGDAKYNARLMTQFCGLELISLFNETVRLLRSGHPAVFQTQDIGPFKADPITPMQPTPTYYALRSISTVLDGFDAVDRDIKFSSTRPLEYFTFRRGEKDLLIAAWIPGRTKQDEIVEELTDVYIADFPAQVAQVFDILNGNVQSLVVSRNADSTVLPEMLIKDYPTFMLLKK